jgi:TonB family protein
MNRWIERDLISLTCKADELDRPLATVQVVAPVHPGPSLQPAIPTGKVTLDFFFDAEGRPRMPVVVSATHDAFAFAAVDALEKWRFTPPTHDGKPVAVRVKQEFVFATRT